MKIIYILFIFFQVILTFAKEPTKVLVLYDSVKNGTFILAKAIAQGAETEDKINAIVQKIDQIRPDELANFDGIAFGSPVYFGGMSSKMKNFLDQTLPIWKERKLAGIPASVFMSSGSGAGNEAAILSMWYVLASHGMLLVSNGSLGMDKIDQSTPQGYTPFGITTLTGARQDGSPSKDELRIAWLQGQLLAKTANAIKRERELILPEAPKAVGDYRPYKISGKNIYINQIALRNGKVLFPGQIGRSVNLLEAKEASKQTALNIISVLKSAVNGDLSKVKNAVQLTGYLNTVSNFYDHALVMDEASKIISSFLGKNGEHARAAIGVSSLPLNSAIEIQAIFELK